MPLSNDWFWPQNTTLDDYEELTHPKNRLGDTLEGPWLDRAEGRIRVSIHPAEGLWTNLPSLPDGAPGAHAKALSDQGDVLLTWQVDNLHMFGTYWKNGADAWEHPKPIGEGYITALSFDPAGTARALVVRGGMSLLDTREPAVELVRRTATGDWVVDDSTSIPGYGSGLRLSAINAQGDALFAWVTPDVWPPGRDPSANAIYAAFRPAGGRWQTALLKGPGGIQSRPWSVTLTDDGVAKVGFLIYDTGSQDARYATATRSADGPEWTTGGMVNLVPQPTPPPSSPSVEPPPSPPAQAAPNGVSSGQPLARSQSSRQVLARPLCTVWQAEVRQLTGRIERAKRIRVKTVRTARVRQLTRSRTGYLRLVRAATHGCRPA